MGTHPIFESDFDCLTEMDQDKQEELKSYMNRLPPPTQAELEALSSYSSTTGGLVGLAGGAGIGMVMVAKMKSRGLGLLGGLTECLKASVTGIPPDPAEMEQYLQQPKKVEISRQQYQQGVHLQPTQPETNQYQTYNNILEQNQARQSQQPSE